MNRVQEQISAESNYTVKCGQIVAADVNALVCPPALQPLINPADGLWTAALSGQFNEPLHVGLGGPFGSGALPAEDRLSDED